MSPTAYMLLCRLWTSPSLPAFFWPPVFWLRVLSTLWSVFLWLSSGHCFRLKWLLNTCVVTWWSHLLCETCRVLLQAYSRVNQGSSFLVPRSALNRHPPRYHRVLLVALTYIPVFFWIVRSLRTEEEVIIYYSLPQNLGQLLQH